MYSSLVLFALVGFSAASIISVNPNALNVPLDEATVALAKNAQLVQQAAEGTRNILGGGIPAALPADTHEVAAGKVAHAIAVARQRASVAGVQGVVAPGVVAPGLVAPGLVAPGVIASRVVAPGLIAPGIVAPGLVAPGLVSASGLLASGIVAPGVLGGLVAPGLLAH
ncbi:Hypothetical protein NTJ_09732 [Nesidiocoris tenuis]|uniref:Uncharacterized protein n=1 Tax=Nesidiocoris tenuis TaxID=355587 RepID=A0ABN7AZD4_9HEMI|nr:Hypothetical protein NTJ_09732 [Nesidiocoris tenuis]